MPPEAHNAFQEFIRHQAAKLRGGDHPPATLAEWEAQRRRLRERLQQAWGSFPEQKAPLEAKIVGEISRETYTIQKILFQTFPGMWMPANAYVPKRAGKSPAVLCVHGHWKFAKQDPHVQARCHGLAQLGFFVLAVDACGAGERGLQKPLGEYHGDFTAGTLWPVGRPLSGVRVYENMRAVDYLQSRPEVDANRIGITGASGGGNQTMYAGAWDERFQAVVPVCSVGNYQAYLQAVCCMCEVVPGALQFTEEWAVLGLVAPRALMVINATKDSIQFSVEEAKKSLARTVPIFQLYNHAERLQHLPVESPHDYNQTMREAMYGWMSLHLRGEGDGKPIPEPKIETLEPELLRCYPNESRPEDYLTIPRFAAREAEAILKSKAMPDHREFWESEAYTMRGGLERVLGPEPEEAPLQLEVQDLENPTGRKLTFDSEPGVRLSAKIISGDTKRWAFIAHAESGEAAALSPLAAQLQEAGWNVVCPDLRATGATAVKGDAHGGAADHKTAQWSLWLGRPLAGQWAYDLRRSLQATLESLDAMPEEIVLIGAGPACIATLLAAIQEPLFANVVLVSPLVSYVSAERYVSQRMGSLLPGVLPAVGNVEHIAALIAPRELLITGGVLGNGEALDVPQIEGHFTYLRRIYGIHRAAKKLSITALLSDAELAARLTEGT